jgi:hypothetical protein
MKALYVEVRKPSQTPFDVGRIAEIVEPFVKENLSFWYEKRKKGPAYRTIPHNGATTSTKTQIDNYYADFSLQTTYSVKTLSLRIYHPVQNENHPLTSQLLRWRVRLEAKAVFEHKDGLRAEIVLHSDQPHFAWTEEDAATYFCRVIGALIHVAEDKGYDVRVDEKFAAYVLRVSPHGSFFVDRI